MYRPLPIAGAPPCAVVLHAAPGTDPAALQQAYANLLGPIGQFYSKVVQMRTLSELPVHNMQLQLPGAQLRYTSNNGLDTVHVLLSVPTSTKSSETKTVMPISTPDFCVVDWTCTGPLVFDQTGYLVGHSTESTRRNAGTYPLYAELAEGFHQDGTSIYNTGFFDLLGLPEVDTIVKFADQAFPPGTGIPGLDPALPTVTLPETAAWIISLRLDLRPFPANAIVKYRIGASAYSGVGFVPGPSLPPGSYPAMLPEAARTGGFSYTLYAAGVEPVLGKRPLVPEEQVNDYDLFPLPECRVWAAGPHLDARIAVDGTVVFDNAPDNGVGLTVIPLIGLISVDRAAGTVVFEPAAPGTVLP